MENKIKELLKYSTELPFIECYSHTNELMYKIRNPFSANGDVTVLSPMSDGFENALNAAIPIMRQWYNELYVPNVFICNECKSYISNYNKCPVCGSRLITLTHTSNIHYIVDALKPQKDDNGNIKLFVDTELLKQVFSVVGIVECVILRSEKHLIIKFGELLYDINNSMFKANQIVRYWKAHKDIKIRAHYMNMEDNYYNILTGYDLIK